MKKRGVLCRNAVKVLIYFLYGTSDETGENVVYVGQAGVRKSGEGILYRLQEHKRNSEKDYWTEAVVLAGSVLSEIPSEKGTDSIKNLRQQHAQKIDENNVLTVDILFKSPSAASSFAAYYAANGLTVWMTESGKSLKQIESNDQEVQ